MRNTKAYFRDHLKANFRALLYIVIAVLVLSFTIAIDEQPTGKLTGDGIIVDYYSTLYIPVIFLCILCYIVPVMEFSFFKKRRNLDCAYSLPISRRAMGTVHYLTGLIIVLGTFTLSYLQNFILLILRGAEHFNFVPMIGHYFLCLLFGAIMYSLFVFVFNEANSVVDGIWFILLWSFIFALSAGAIEAILTDITNSYSVLFDVWGHGIPWVPLDSITTVYQNVVERNDNATLLTYWADVERVLWFVFWILIGVGSAVGFFLNFGKRSAEMTEEVSESIFGYKVLIPAYAITGMLIFDVSDYALLWMIIELLAFIGYTIYRRGFHYKKSDFIILALMLVFLFV